MNFTKQITKNYSDKLKSQNKKHETIGKIRIKKDFRTAKIEATSSNSRTIESFYYVSSERYFGYYLFHNCDKFRWKNNYRGQVNRCTKTKLKLIGIWLASATVRRILFLSNGGRKVFGDWVRWKITNIATRKLWEDYNEFWICSLSLKIPWWVIPSRHLCRVKVIFHRTEPNRKLKCCCISSQWWKFKLRQQKR